jgi:hypothetical protein
LAPTGKAVDVAVREGAGDDGLTIAKALQLLRNNQLELRPQTMVIVDEAAMVGTDDLRQLLTATTAAGVKTVLVGDAHQLAPVKARGGMFTQLCTDLPWTQHLSQVWRMRDAQERAASLALRNGGPASVRRAIGCYRTHDRLHSGDPITMAADALAAYNADFAAGKDMLLVCDTTEMADALNGRLHHDTISAQAPTVTGAHGHRISVGDLILTRRNDHSVDVHPGDNGALLDPVRNGNRWRVAAVDAATNRVAAERLDDKARAVFGGDYVRAHVTHGYAVNVHFAQGVTADTTHAVLSETATRALFYVAISRGRDANTAYLYEYPVEREYDHQQIGGAQSAQRRTSRHAGRLARAIIANDGGRPETAHGVASHAEDADLPDRVRWLLSRRAAAVQRTRHLLGTTLSLVKPFGRGQLRRTLSWCFAGCGGSQPQGVGGLTEATVVGNQRRQWCSGCGGLSSGEVYRVERAKCGVDVGRRGGANDRVDFETVQPGQHRRHSR